MSLTEALVQLNVLDKKIRKAIQNGCYVNLRIGNDTLQHNCDPSASLTKVNDLQKRRNAIQKAKLKANAETVVVIAGKTMTIMEAIERKNSIEYEEILLDTLREQLTDAQNSVLRHNTKVQERLDKQLEETYGKAGKVRPEDYETIAKPFLANNEAKLEDPIDIQEEIDKLDDYIDTFKSEVDIRLSEINARTMIEVEY
jgi:uncharacterized protein YicC (UPF0701 family)